MEQVSIDALDPGRFETVLDTEPYRRFAAGLSRAVECFNGRRLWCVNSTDKGGGIAEMLPPLLGYLLGAGIDVRWVVIGGDRDFFVVTKRIHHRLHGGLGDGGRLDEAALATYEETLRSSAEELAGKVSAGDVVIVHDPQPAGMIPALIDAGATVIWRCHVGIDVPNDAARSAWAFLLPFVSEAHACVFSRSSYVWEGLDEARTTIVQPSIDVFSPKNQELDEGSITAILRAAGILRGEGGASPEFVRPDGTRATVSRRAELIEDVPLDLAAPMVLQVSRWDRLKDPLGVLRGFARHMPRASQLVLAGPMMVPDDPEEADVFAEVRQAREDLPEDIRRRVHVVSLPMKDAEENAAIVNALQRRADVVVQKSVQEGFGLTVAEAMWKRRPVVASRVGGIQDQIVDGESGLLVDPEDLPAFGRSVSLLLEDPPAAEAMGRAAHERVRSAFLGPRHLMQYAELIGGLVPVR